MTPGDKNKNKNKIQSGLINKKKQVSVDESSNEVWIFPRISPQEKPNVWLTKTEIGQFRKEAQEEVMMEQVRNLVKAKLVEEYSKECEYDGPTGTDASNEEDLEERVKQMEGRLDRIMKQSHEQILSFLEPSSFSAAAKEEPSTAAAQLSLIEQSSTTSTTSTSTSTSKQQQSDDEEDSSSFNWLSDCTEYWHDIPADIQQAAKDLGFTQPLWDNSLQPEESNKWWLDLSASQRKAAEKLGYHRTTWDQQSGQSPMNDDGSNGFGTAAKKQKRDETANQAEPKNKNNKDADEEAEQDKRMPNSLSDNNKEDSQEEAEQEIISKLLSEGEEDSEERVQRNEFDSSLHSDKIEDSQGTPPTTTSDEDEDEFISNFLSDDKTLSALLQEQAPVADNNSSRSSLEQMYVPSDDEFDEDEDGFDEGEDQDLELESSLLIQTTTTAPPTEDKQQEESTPLLGLGHAVPASKSNLFHRLRTNLLASNVDPYCHVPLRGDNDDKPKTQVHGRNKWPAGSLYPILILILGLILFWFGYTRYIVV
jgi:hypothetical protein